MKRFLFAAVMMLGMTFLVYSQDNYSQWSYYRNVTINTKASGANVATAVVKFPVLVRLTAADSLLFKNALTNGADVRFAKANGEHLPYQIEQWNSTAKTAAIWVLIDTIKGNDSASYFKMYYGKTGAADSSKGTAVFDTANGFQAVWHLGEAVDATNKDATVNAFDGTPTSMTDVSGIIGNAKAFDGSSSYMNTTGTETGKLAFSEKGTYTVSTWFYANSTTGPNYIVSKGQNHYSLYFRSSSAGLAICETNTARESAETPVTGLDSRWVYAVGVRNGETVSLYVDGTLASSTLVSTAATRNTTYTVQLGRRSDNSGSYFNGTIDESQIANVARSADWIKLSYESQKETATLVKLGAAIQQTTGVIAAVPHYVSSKLGHNGVLEVYMVNGSRVMELAYGASATKTQLLNTASKTLAKGYYTYRFRSNDANVDIVGKLVK
jgi:biopolymer transport protein ExbB